MSSAELLLACATLAPNLAFFSELGFRLAEILPADDPSEALLVGHGLRLRLVRGGDAPPARLRLWVDDASDAGERVAPNGTRVELRLAGPPWTLPAAEPAFERSAQASWQEGRAGMRYRDLVPSRQGGRLIASQIRIEEGGPVPDYVHYHEVRYQLILCLRGWVEVVYQDQGPPFRLEPGDCVLQPPTIRHRVLSCSPGLEVLELGSPARHPTRVDHELELPTGVVDPERRFGGQRFVRHRASEASWEPWRHAGYEARDTGIAAATGGLLDVRVARPAGEPEPDPWTHPGELRFLFVSAGELTLQRSGEADALLRAGDAVVLPPGLEHALARPSADLELIEALVAGA
ncbi:MAG TPA: cupin [Planctomycetes bacterium]|nr:cupin [Planctomycetota bacterium]